MNELPKDKLAKKIIAEVMDLKKDVFGGRGRYGWDRPMIVPTEIRSRPKEDNKSPMSRYQQEK